MNQPIRSPIFYHGSKFRLIEWIEDKLPEPNCDRIFWDMFSGSGTAGLNLGIKYKKIVFNEKDQVVHRLQKWALTFDETKNENFKSWFYAKMEYCNIFQQIDMRKTNLKIKDFENTIEYKNWLSFVKSINQNSEPEEIFYYLCGSFSHKLSYSKNNKLPISYGCFSFSPNWLNRFLPASINKDKSEFLNDDVFNLFEKVKEGDFVYLDPPYLITSASYDDLWKVEDQRKLFLECEKLNNRGIKFSMSGVFENKGKFNFELSDWCKKNNWTVHKLNFAYSLNGISGYAQEVLICNFEHFKSGKQLELFNL